MGLAEPRKRIKLSHDPRNTTWTSDTTSFGHRYMLSSGWTPGTALGASSISLPASEASAAKVRIAVKDDTLGLGASLKSRNVEHQRTGLDAFQGLLGRLNAKDDREVLAVERKIEDKKLAMFAVGRWGGMTFVPGERLVQDDQTKKIPLKQETAKEKEQEVEGIVESTSEAERTGQNTKTNTKTKRKSKSRRNERMTSSGDDTANEVQHDTAEAHAQKAPQESEPEHEQDQDERSRRKAEKRQRKAERQLRKEAKQLRKLQKESGQLSDTVSATDESLRTSTTNTGGTSTPVSASEKAVQSVSVTAIAQQRLSNGRHLLRGRNIQAKRLAFSDAKGLDQIFMRQAPVQVQL